MTCKSMLSGSLIKSYWLIFIAPEEEAYCFTRMLYLGLDVFIENYWIIQSLQIRLSINLTLPGENNPAYIQYY